jgi:hypothetical protein
MTEAYRIQHRYRQPPNEPLLPDGGRERFRFAVEFVVRPPLGLPPFVVAAGLRILKGIAPQ